MRAHGSYSWSLVVPAGGVTVPTLQLMVMSGRYLVVTSRGVGAAIISCGLCMLLSILQCTEHREWTLPITPPKYQRGEVEETWFMACGQSFRHSQNRQESVSSSSLLKTGSQNPLFGCEGITGAKLICMYTSSKNKTPTLGESRPFICKEASKKLRLKEHLGSEGIYKGVNKEMLRCNCQISGGKNTSKFAPCLNLYSY